MTKKNSFIDMLTHDLPTVVLGIGAAFGIDSSETNIFMQSISTIITAVFTIIPIVIHAYKNRGYALGQVKKEISNPSKLVADVNSITPEVAKYLPKDVAAKVSDVEQQVTQYAKAVEDLKGSYKQDIHDIQGYAEDIAVELKKEIAAKYDPLLKDVSDLKTGKGVNKEDVLSTLSSVLEQAQQSQHAQEDPSSVQGVVKTVNEVSQKEAAPAVESSASEASTEKPVG